KAKPARLTLEKTTRRRRNTATTLPPSRTDERQSRSKLRWRLSDWRRRNTATAFPPLSRPSDSTAVPAGPAPGASHEKPGRIGDARQASWSFARAGFRMLQAQRWSAAPFVRPPRPARGSDEETTGQNPYPASPADRNFRSGSRWGGWRSTTAFFA